ncbi:Imm65 family immunity protein [uncultured Bacteroides sp.]|uniref:Imm65 family immunity protein n=1 Tax=uncultured Bacteroides sp. TaxID=162156 RepID=UPI0025E2C5C0|nr:Imm65 family immunity protein [uncultured Bacteroides sp.]
MNMNKKGIALLSLLIWLLGCIQRPDDVYQRAIGYVMPLIDSGYITDNYIHLYEMGMNDSSSIYTIFGSDSVISNFTEFPSKIVMSGGKYFCFVELDEPELSVEQVNRITNCYNDIGIGYPNSDIWYMGISKYKDNGVLIKQSQDAWDMVDYPELWPYYSGGQPDRTDFYMWLVSHDMVLSKSDSLFTDNFKFYIRNIYGKIEVYNKSDSTIILASDVPDKACVVSGHDTLMLALRDSLPFEIAPNSLCVLHYESEQNDSFFQKLPTKNTWMSLYELLSDSTYCFLKINGESKTIHLLHNDFQSSSKIVDDSGNVLKRIWNEGIFDKDKRRARFWGISTASVPPMGGILECI